MRGIKVCEYDWVRLGSDSILLVHESHIDRSRNRTLGRNANDLSDRLRIWSAAICDFLSDGDILRNERGECVILVALGLHKLLGDLLLGAIHLLVAWSEPLSVGLVAHFLHLWLDILPSLVADLGCIIERHNWLHEPVANQVLMQIKWMRLGGEHRDLCSSVRGTLTRNSINDLRGFVIVVRHLIVRVVLVIE